MTEPRDRDIPRPPGGPTMTAPARTRSSFHEIFDLDYFRNGRAGALPRMTSGLASAGLPLAVLNHFHEDQPLRIEGTLPALDDYRQRLEAPGEWIEGCLSLRDTVLLGRFGLPFLPGHNRYLVGDGMNQHHDAAELPDTAAAGEARPMGRAFVVGGRGAGIYGHWLMDFIPQLLTAIAAAREFPAQPRIVLLNPAPFGQNLIRFLGLSERCEVAPRNTAMAFERLYLPLIAKHGRRYSSEVLRRSFAHMLKRAAPGAVWARRHGMRRLLVGRRTAPRCGNFDALERALSPLGFSTVFPEDYPYPVQFQIFHQAEIVVGEDGSALHNAGFCRPGTPLVVFSRGNRVIPWHGAVARAADLPLVYLQSLPRADGGHDAPIDDILARI